MTRKMAYIGFAFLAGLFSASIGWGRYIINLTVVAYVLIMILFFVLEKYRVYVFAMAMFFFTGIIYFSAYTHFIYDKVMLYDDKEIVFTGVIKDYSYLGSNKARITVDGKIDDKVNAKITFFVEDDYYSYYDKVEIKSKVTKIYDKINFRSEYYNRPKGEFLRSSGSVKVKLLERNTRPFLNAIKTYRDYLFNKINYIVQGEEGGFLGAMLCGDKSQLSSITRTKLYRAGLGHILAVSGTHLSIVTMCFYLVIYILIKNRRIRFIILLCIVWSFALFAGFSPSVVRAAIMMSTILLCDLTFLKADAMNTLGLCVLIMTLKNPYIVRDPSFMLSVSGAISIGVIVPYVLKRVKYEGLLGGFVKTGLVLLVPVFASVPVQLLFFDEISLAAPLSNLILLPICVFALAMCVIVVVTGGVGFIAYPVLKVAGWLVHIVLSIAEKISSFRYSYVDITSTKMRFAIAVICMFTVIAYLIVKKMRYVVAFSLIGYCLVIIVSNFTMIKDAGVVHYIFIPNKNKCQVLVYENSDCVITDIGSNGKNNHAVCSAMTKRGIRSTQSIMIFNNCYYTAQQYMNVLYPQPVEFYGDFDSETDLYKTDKHISFKDIELNKTDNCCEVSAYNTKTEIDGSSFSINGMEFNLKEEKYPIEMIIDNKGIEVWRLDYGFDKQYRLG